jgi:hypothetical protein
MITPRPSVIYRKPVSDGELKLVFERIADALGASLTVHSGDRDYRPKGSPSKSLHLRHRAADFHVSGIPDCRAFELLKRKRQQLGPLTIKRLQIIHHGPYTETEAEHLHIGDYALIKALVLGPGITFLAEGETPATKGRYHIVHY